MANFKTGFSKKKLCIVGFSPTSAMDFTKLNPAEWDIWGMNDFYRVDLSPTQKIRDVEQLINMFSAWFEIHDRNAYDDLKVTNKLGAEHIASLNALSKSIPVYVQDTENFKDIEGQVYFPAREMAKYFFLDHGYTPYFTSTPTWLLMFAVYSIFHGTADWDEILLVGVDMQVGWYKNSNGVLIQNEYSVQRPSCEFALGLIHGLKLAGKNVRYTLPQKSSLMKLYGAYGFENMFENQLKQDLVDRLNFINTQNNNITNMISQTNARYEQEMRQLHAESSKIVGHKNELELQISHLPAFEKTWADVLREREIVEKKEGKTEREKSGIPKK